MHLVFFAQSMMTELHHRFAKAEPLTRVGPMTGSAEIVNGEATQEALEDLDQGPDSTMPMEMLL